MQNIYLKEHLQFLLILNELRKKKNRCTCMFLEIQQQKLYKLEGQEKNVWMIVAFLDKSYKK